MSEKCRCAISHLSTVNDDLTLMRTCIRNSPFVTFSFYAAIIKLYKIISYNFVYIHTYIILLIIIANAGDDGHG